MLLVLMEPLYRGICSCAVKVQQFLYQAKEMTIQATDGMQIQQEAHPKPSKHSGSGHNRKVCWPPLLASSASKEDSLKVRVISDVMDFQEVARVERWLSHCLWQDIQFTSIMWAQGTAVVQVRVSIRGVTLTSLSTVHLSCPISCVLPLSVCMRGVCCFPLSSLERQSGAWKT